VSSLSRLVLVTKSINFGGLHETLPQFISPIDVVCI